MKLAHKAAGLCGSGVFILTAIPGFYQHVKPTSMEGLLHDVLQAVSVWETLGVSLLGAFLAGSLGYVIGDILSNPKGKAPAKGSDKSEDRSAPGKSPGAAAVMVTGEETFLDDIAPMPPEAESLTPEQTPLAND